jgi:hypothetical protein
VRLIAVLIWSVAVVGIGAWMWGERAASSIMTAGPCSPVAPGARGNMTVTINGGCTSGIAPADSGKIVENVQARRPIPPDLQNR